MSYVCGGFASAENQRLRFIIARVVVLLRVQNLVCMGCRSTPLSCDFPSRPQKLHGAAKAMLLPFATCREKKKLRSSSSPFFENATRGNFTKHCMRNPYGAASL